MFSRLRQHEHSLMKRVSTFHLCIPLAMGGRGCRWEIALEGAVSSGPWMGCGDGVWEG